MKPVKLTMSAFGPYAGVTEIDFTRLGENGGFLIAVIHIDDLLPRQLEMHARFECEVLDMTEGGDDAGVTRRHRGDAAQRDDKHAERHAAEADEAAALFALFRQRKHGDKRGENHKNADEE